MTPKPRVGTRATLRLVLFLMALLAALAVGHYGVYERFIIPRIPFSEHDPLGVPSGLLALVYGPTLAVCLAMGALLPTWRQVATCACAAALMDGAFTLWLWRSGAPGYAHASEYGVLEAAYLSVFMLPAFFLSLGAAFAVGCWLAGRSTGRFTRDRQR